MEQAGLTTDVLVLGGGGAGLRAALEARRAGVDVVLVSKQPAGGTSCTAHGAGYFTWCAEAARDELRRQMLVIGGCVNDPAMLDAFLADVPTRIPELTELGVALTREEVLPGLGYWRTSRGEGSHAGYGLTAPLRGAADAAGIRVIDGAAAIHLLGEGRAVAGAAVYEPGADRLLGIGAKATVLATGGGAALWKRSDNPRGTTGDGFALALEAGAALTHMEFVSFHCPDLAAVLSGSADREDTLARGSAHYFLGGVATDPDGHTTVDGLLAAGEVANGPHGAARLGGGAFAEIIVFGARAGAAAARRARAVASPALPDRALDDEAARLARYRASHGPSPARLRRRLADTMWLHAGLLKDRASLGRAAGQLEALVGECERAAATSPDDVLVAEQTRLSCLTGLEVMGASQWREESRGAFWRTDHPAPDNARWLVRRTVRIREGRREVDVAAIARPAGIGLAEPKIGAGCFGYLRRGD